EEKRQLGLDLGAHEAFESGGGLPERVDVVIETVGRATWGHSLRCLRPGGTVVVAGATSGPDADADLARMFYNQLRVVGSTGCTRGEMIRLLRFIEAAKLRPTIDRAVPLENIADGFQIMIDGTVSGKIVVTI